MILKLEALDREHRLRYTDIRHVWINSDDISYFESITEPRGHAQGSVVWTRSGGYHVVAISPDELAAAIDPENACPDGPGNCGYQEYLAYRKDGESDLGHGAYHAAVTIHERHASGCTVWERSGPCSVCTAGEKRIRA